jgi:hypothetical protein
MISNRDFINRILESKFPDLIKQLMLNPIFKKMYPNIDASILSYQEFETKIKLGMERIDKASKKKH